MKKNNKLLEYMNKEYKTILRSFSPDIMSVFINDNYSEVEFENDSDTYKRNRQVYFHEMYHFWQTLFTPFGQLRWYQTIFSSDEIIKAWTRLATMTADEKMRKIPIGNLVKNNDKASLVVSMSIKMSNLNLMNLNLMLRSFWNDDLDRTFHDAYKYLSPIVKVNDKQYKLEGLDIIETFDKFQEALYGYIVLDIPFDKTMNYDNLKKEYYLPYVYYLNEIGNDIEFPAVCEMALMTNKIGDLKNEEDWKQYHPAWRFVKIIEVLKDDKNIPHINPNKIKKTYKKFINYILKKCEFKDVKSIWKGMRITETGKWKSALENEKNVAADFKAKYPWILSYPFYNHKKAIKMIYKFEPHFLIYTDEHITILERDEKLYGKSGSYMGKWESETAVELHKLALSNQIVGIKSKRYIHKDMLQCGCGYYNVNICPYYGEECNGYLERENEFHKSLNDGDKKLIASTVEKIIEV